MVSFIKVSRRILQSWCPVICGKSFPWMWSEPLRGMIAWYDWLRANRSWGLEPATLLGIYSLCWIYFCAGTKIRKRSFYFLPKPSNAPNHQLGSQLTTESGNEVYTWYPVLTSQYRLWKSGFRDKRLRIRIWTSSLSVLLAWLC